MGFFELLVIAVVGLVVIGPERLPQVMKSAMVWSARIKHLLNETRSEFEQQLGVDEIRRDLHNERVMESIKALQAAKEQLEQESGELETAAAPLLKTFAEDEDEGLYGEQRANHQSPPGADNASHQPENH